MLSCSSCEDNYESGSTGSSDVLCSHCFVPREHLAFEKRKTTGIQKPKKKSKLLQTTAVKEPSSFGLNDTLDVGGADSFTSDFIDNDAFVGDSSDQTTELFPRIDEWLCDLSPRRQVLQESGNLVFSQFMTTGFIWAVIDESSGDVLTLYQHVGGYLIQVGNVDNFPVTSRLLTEPLEFGVMVLTEAGVNALLPSVGGLEMFDIAPAWPPKVKSVNFGAIFKLQGQAGSSRAHINSVVRSPVQASFRSPAFPLVDVGGDECDLSEPFVFKDLSTVGTVFQAKYREAGAFRVLCFNIKARWSHLAGSLCSLEAESTWRNVVSLVPPFLHPLTIFSREYLPILLGLRFSLAPSMTFLPRSKKPESFDLLSFAFESEKVVTVDLLLSLLQRLVRFLGSVSNDSQFYDSLFSDIKAVLCPSSTPFSMCTWEPEFVFKWIATKFFAVSVVFGSDRSEVLSKADLLIKLRTVVSFEYCAEQAQYLGSLEYQSRISRLHSASIGAIVSVPCGYVPLVNKVPVSAQWCMQHAKFSMSLAGNPCPLGLACTRLHPVLMRPFSDSQKISLRGLANIIRVPASKDSFLSAIN